MDGWKKDQKENQRKLNKRKIKWSLANQINGTHNCTKYSCRSKRYDCPHECSLSSSLLLIHTHTHIYLSLYLNISYSAIEHKNCTKYTIRKHSPFVCNVHIYTDSFTPSGTDQLVPCAHACKQARQEFQKKRKKLFANNIWKKNPAFLLNECNWFRSNAHKTDSTHEWNE